ncbi:MAG: myo-inosose-2 dehydratase [Crocosphaera sp.]|nr:myo-inosose-2 dehydratase [Crocosphaera sp.]
MFKQISRLLMSLMLVILIGITNTLPANAGIDIHNRDKLISLVPPATREPIFNPEKVRLGITPTGWSNSDDLTIDLVPPIPYQQILSEMALSGFKGSQGAPKFPSDLQTLKNELNLRGLTISEPWVGTYFTIGGQGKEESQRIFQEQMAFMKNFDSNVIVVAELGGAVHQQPIEPLNNRPHFNDEQWGALTNGLNELGKQAYDNGMVLCYHPHVGTGVETLQDIDRLMEGTDAKYLKLLLDTGHLYYAGVDPLEVTQKYASRIGHVHLKNIREEQLELAKQEGTSFLNAIRNGIFTVPGDTEGIIQFEPIFQELANVNYEGWLMVEAEQDPNKANPLTYALMARNYLREVTGL